MGSARCAWARAATAARAIARAAGRAAISMASATSTLTRTVDPVLGIAALAKGSVRTSALRPWERLAMKRARSAAGTCLLVALGAIIASGACAGSVRYVDHDAGGGTGGAGATGGSGGIGTGGSVGASGGTGGSGAGGPCISCNEWLAGCSAECPDPSTLCAGAASETWEVMAICVCTECLAECPSDVCPNGTGSSPEDCATCQMASLQSSCSVELSDCANN